MALVRLLRASRPTTSGTWRVSLRWLNAYREELSDLGITPAQARALLYLQRNPGSSVLHCARVFRVSGSTMRHLVRGLLLKRLVMNQRLSPPDRSVLALTPIGHLLVLMIHRRLTKRLVPLTAKAS
jgi:DNA-binding MarR family transcriptional regulator